MCCHQLSPVCTGSVDLWIAVNDGWKIVGAPATSATFFLTAAKSVSQDPRAPQSRSTPRRSRHPASSSRTRIVRIANPRPASTWTAATTASVVCPCVGIPRHVEGLGTFPPTTGASVRVEVRAPVFPGSEPPPFRGHTRSAHEV